MHYTHLYAFIGVYRGIYIIYIGVGRWKRGCVDVYIWVYVYVYMYMYIEAYECKNGIQKMLMSVCIICIGCIYIIYRLTSNDAFWGHGFIGFLPISFIHCPFVSTQPGWHSSAASITSSSPLAAADSGDSSSSSSSSKPPLQPLNIVTHSCRILKQHTYAATTKRQV